VCARLFSDAERPLLQAGKQNPPASVAQTETPRSSSRLENSPGIRSEIVPLPLGAPRARRMWPAARLLYIIWGSLGQRDKPLTTPQDKECSVVSGLHFNEQLMLTQINQIPWKEATDRIKVFAQRYGLDTKQERWVERIPNLQEQQTARRDMGTVAQGQRMLDYQQCRKPQGARQGKHLGFQSDMEDIRGAHTEQELSKIGLGWSVRAKNYDERTQILAGLLNMIGQKVPSDSMIETQGRTKLLQQQGIIK
jgi:hypothetical protein